MAHRRHGSIPSYLLWAMVALGDLVLIVVNAGLTVLITVLCLATGGALAGCASRLRRARQRVQATTAAVPATTAVPIERDA